MNWSLLFVSVLATWVQLNWTLPPAPSCPAGCREYVLQRRYKGGEWSGANLYDMNHNPKVHPTNVGGVEDSGLVSVSANYRLGSQELRLFITDSLGNWSPPSNRVVLLGGCPDTLWAMVRLGVSNGHGGTTPYSPGTRIGFRLWQYKSGLVKWNLQFPDTLEVDPMLLDYGVNDQRVEIWSQEDIQRLYRPILCGETNSGCSHGSYWALRGTYQCCSDTVGVLQLPDHCPGSPDSCP